MALKELTLLDGTVDKVAIAITRLQTFEPPEGYYVAFSGGKDSVVIYDLCKKAGVKFDAHYHLTTVDPPELVRFVRAFPGIQVTVPEMSMWQLIRKKKALPTRARRWCCRELKEGGGGGRRVVTGVRWEESHKRKGRRMVEPCSVDKSKTFLNPIIDWTADEVWQYIRENDLPYCSVYDEGWKRLGCVLCPNHRPGGEKDAARWPKIAAQYRRLANEVWTPDSNFPSGDAYYEWWISTRSLPNTDQLEMGVYE
jgi:phosphoadenosine phosphosulfate reductase